MFFFLFYSEVQSMITPNDKTPSPQYTNLLNLIESIRKKTNELEKLFGENDDYVLNYLYKSNILKYIHAKYVL